MKNDYENITIVIPTFNRSGHLSRLINYYASKKSNLFFLILDSSSESEAIELNRQTCMVLGSSAKHVVSHSSMPVTTKLLNGLKLVETPFCVFCADDDLIFIESLMVALDYLKTHPEYICVDGIYLNFYKKENTLQIRVEYGNTGIHAGHPGARIFRLFQKYESLFYGVFKTADIVNIFSGVNNISSFHYQELFQATAALLMGKSQRLPIFYAGRQHCDPAETTRDKWQTYYWFSDNPMEFIEHYASYRDELWRFYDNHITDAKLEKDAFHKVMDLSHAVFFSAGCPPEYFHSVLQHYWPMDSFHKPNAYNDNICYQLKKAHQKLLDLNLERIAKYIQKKTALFIAKKHIQRLNKETTLKCVLPEEMRWLAGIDDFRKAYRELCWYYG